MGGGDLPRLPGALPEEGALTRQLAEEARETIRRPDGRLDRQGLLSLPPPVREAILLELLETAGKQSARLVEEMERAGGCGCSPAAGWWNR